MLLRNSCVVFITTKLNHINRNHNNRVPRATAGGPTQRKSRFDSRGAARRCNPRRNRLTRFHYKSPEMFPSRVTKAGWSNAFTGGSGSSERSMCTRQLCALVHCARFDVPASCVSTLGLPCTSKLPKVAGSRGSYQAPVGNAKTNSLGDLCRRQGVSSIVEQTHHVGIADAARVRAKRIDVHHFALFRSLRHGWCGLNRTGCANAYSVGWNGVPLELSARG